MAGPVLYLALACQRSLREPSGIVLKNLIKVCLGQNVSCSPRRPGTSQAGDGKSQEQVIQRHTHPRHQFQYIEMGWGWQLAGAVPPEGVAGTSDGTRSHPAPREVGNTCSEEPRRRE